MQIQKNNKNGKIQLNLEDLKKRIVEESKQLNVSYADFQITFDNDSNTYYLNTDSAIIKEIETLINEENIWYTTDL